VRGYDDLARGHLPAAMQVMTGAADCAIATKAAARVFGLDFITLVRERYDLVLRKKHLDMPELQALCDTLGRAQFRTNAR
jgi:putative molybdopterin biosynthesis protein